MLSEKKKPSIFFHKFVGAIYAVGFYSCIVQFRGLYGNNGLLPVVDYVSVIRNHFQNQGGKNLVESLLLNYPSLPVFANELGVTADSVSEAMLCTGLISSIAIVLGGTRDTSPPTVCFIICWLCYLGIVLVGQTFLSFQWDILLVEVGFLCIFTNFSSSHIKDSLCNWGFRFLAFKLMFCAGVVKIQALCPTWEDLSALEYHFATQPISNPVSWFAHQLPPIFLRLGVAATLLIEIPCALLLVSPFLLQRRIGVVLQGVLQVLIILTGNYNFFNALTIALMVPVWASDDENETVGGWRFSSYFSFLKQVNDTVLGNVLQFAVLILFVLVSATSMFHLSTAEVEWWTGSQLTVKMKWGTMQQYTLPACGLGLSLCACHAALYGVNKLFDTVQAVFPPLSGGDKRKGRTRWVFGIWWKLPLAMVRLTWDSVYTAVIVTWIFLAAVPLSGICDTSLLIPKFVHALHQKTQGYHLVSGYGLFRRMTGVGPTTAGTEGFKPSIVARPEVVLEGLQGSTNTWKEIHFKYKPTDLHQPPPFVAPHQPRLDWQLWFAALESYQHNPWFVHLVWKLLCMDPSVDVDTGSGMHTVPAAAYAYPEVLALLDTARYPFPLGDPPRAIRAYLYDYDFTRVDEGWTQAQPTDGIIRNMTLVDAWNRGISQVSSVLTGNGTSDGQWWYRRNRREYLPAVARGDKNIPTMLKQAAGIFDRPRSTQRQLFADCQKQAGRFQSKMAAGSLAREAVKVAQHLTCSTLLLNEHENITLSHVVAAALPSSVAQALGLPVVASKSASAGWKEVCMSVEFIAVTAAIAYAAASLLLTSH